ncbi:MAG TPA: hypothetical protein PKL83_01815 [bacterium]|nr:hypothetical protein [bacterium]
MPSHWEIDMQKRRDTMQYKQVYTSDAAARPMRARYNRWLQLCGYGVLFLGVCSVFGLTLYYSGNLEADRQYLDAWASRVQSAAPQSHGGVLSLEALVLSGESSAEYLAEDLDNPKDFIIDRQDFLYVSEYDQGSILLIRETGSIQTWVEGIAHPAGMTIDQNGDIIVAAIDRAYRIQPDGTATIMIDKGLFGVRDVYSSGSGKIFFTDLDKKTMYEALPAGGVKAMVADLQGLSDDCFRLLLVTKNDTIYLQDRTAQTVLGIQNQQEVTIVAEGIAGVITLGPEEQIWIVDRGYMARLSEPEVRYPLPIAVEPQVAKFDSQGRLVILTAEQDIVRIQWEL